MSCVFIHHTKKGQVAVIFPETHECTFPLPVLTLAFLPDLPLLPAFPPRSAFPHSSSPAPCLPPCSAPQIPACPHAVRPAGSPVCCTFSPLSSGLLAEDTRRSPSSPRQTGKGVFSTASLLAEAGK